MTNVPPTRKNAVIKYEHNRAVGDVGLFMSRAKCIAIYFLLFKYLIIGMKLEE